MPEINSFGENLKRNMSRVIVGKGEIIERALAILLSGGHVLINDVPGVGKTVFARSLAISWGWISGEYSVHPTFSPVM